MFCCSAMSGATIPEARRRFGAVRAALASGDSPCGIKVGFAELKPADTAGELIARADTQLFRGDPGGSATLA